MKGVAIDQLVFECIFTKPKPNDPQNFQGFLQRSLVNEVRAETTAFYGSLDSRESQYPGLDYSYPPHRKRLGRFPWHRKLFRAFDTLGLTRSEIAGLTKWEGTIWAKERFEKEQGIVIRDTTGDCISDWVPPELRLPAKTPRGRPSTHKGMETVGLIKDVNDAEDLMDEDSDGELSSIGADLNERLRAAVDQREAGNADIVIDAEFEQWLKEAAEVGMVPGSWATSDSAEALPRLINAARRQQLNPVPDFLRGMMSNLREAGGADEVAPTASNSTRVDASLETPPTRSIVLAGHVPGEVITGRARLMRNSQRRSSITLSTTQPSQA